MGTPELAKTILAALIERTNIIAVVTQPDKPAGRGHKLKSPPVKLLARLRDIPVYQPRKLRDPQFISVFESADMIIVAAYGRILPPSILNAPPLGCINIHASLLPKYRGAAPIQRAIINGETETGITVMRMDEGLDTGDVILKKPIPILSSDTYGTLYDKLARLGIEAIFETLDLFEKNAVTYQRQDDSISSYASMILPDTAIINWSKSSKNIVNLIRGLNPDPVARTGNFKIWAAESISVQLSQSHKHIVPGEILDIQTRGIVVRSGELSGESSGESETDAVLITELQAKGGKRMSAQDYLRGHSLNAGSCIQNL
jgi:methionyl-tRNA formyltransferase